MPAPNDAPMKPLIFCNRSVLAWQQNAKTQTRRLVRPQPDNDDWYLKQQQDGCWVYTDRDDDGVISWPSWARPIRQPYAVGDLLWIREALVSSERYDPTSSTYADMVAYCADGEYAKFDGWPRYWCWERSKLPAMFMPRWACRYYARVVSVRPERLQAITDEDALAEGVLVDGAGQPWRLMTRPRLYFSWWDSLHKKPGTRSGENPVIWRYVLEPLDNANDL